MGARLALPRPLLGLPARLSLRLPLDRGRVGGHGGGGGHRGQGAVLVEDGLEDGGRGRVGVLRAAGVDGVTGGAQGVVLLVPHCRV